MPAASMGIMDLHLSCSCFDFGALAAGWVATNVRMAEYAGGPHAKATLQAVPARRVELVVGARERRAVRCTVAPIGARIFAAPRLFRLHGVAWFVVASILLYLRHLAAFESSLSRFEPVAFVLAFANDAVPSQSLERKIVPLAKGTLVNFERKSLPAHCVSSIACGRRFAVFGTFLGTSCLLLFFLE